MIAAGARLSIERIPLDCLQVKEYQHRYPAQLAHYIELLDAHPGEYAGLLSVTRSSTHQGMYALLDGHTRFCGYVMTGRHDALCLVIDEQGDTPCP